MLIINIYFLIVFAKFFLFFRLIRLKILKKLKKSLLLYFIYDVHLTIAVIIIYFLDKNHFFNAIFLGTGPLAFLFQCYQIFNLINLITQANHKIDFLEYNLFIFGFLIGLSRLIFNINFYMKNNAFDKVHLVNVFNDSKLLFFAAFLAFIIFQFYFVFTSLVHFFFYLYHYRIKKSFLQKGLFLFFFVLLIKIALDYFQLNILQFFKIVNHEEDISNLVRLQSDEFLHIISLFGFLLYLSIFYFIHEANKILHKQYSFLIKKANLPIFLFINTKHTIEMNLEGRSFQDLILAVALENIQRTFSFQDEVVFVFLHDLKNTHDVLFYEKTSFLYKEILKNNIIVYDYYYDYLYISSLDIDHESTEHKNKKEILDFLEEQSIRLLIPFFSEGKIFGYIKISLKTITSKSIFLDDELVYLYNIARYIEEFLSKVYKDPFYRRLKYQNKISEFNLLENNNLFKNFYEHLNTKIQEISQIIVLEDRKEECSLYGLKEFHKKNLNFTHFLKIIHKNIEQKELQEIQTVSAMTDMNNYDFSIFSSGKVKIGRFKITFHSFLPFIKKKNNIFSIIILNQKINTIFPEFLPVFENERLFFSQFDMNYTIKIIISPHYSYYSFFKIIDYVVINIPCVVISLKNISIDEDKILNYFKYLLNSQKKYYIFFVDIDHNVYEIQYAILDLYSDYVIFVEKILIKLFFVVENANCIKNIHYKIIQASSSLFYQESSVHDVAFDDMFQFLKNYTLFILKKQYSDESIIKFIQENYFFLKQTNSIYYFLDSFEKMIYAYRFKNIKSTYSKEFYIQEASRRGKEALKNIILMDELGKIYDYNFTHIAALLGVHKSSVSRFFKKKSLTDSNEEPTKLKRF